MSKGYTIQVGIGSFFTCLKLWQGWAFIRSTGGVEISDIESWYNRSSLWKKCRPILFVFMDIKWKNCHAFTIWDHTSSKTRGIVCSIRRSCLSCYYIRHVLHFAASAFSTLSTIQSIIITTLSPSTWCSRWTIWIPSVLLGLRRQSWIPPYATRR